MKLRKHDWFNMKTRGVAYGIQGQEKPGDPWLPVANGGVLTIFPTEQQRDDCLKYMRKHRAAQFVEKAVS